MIRGNAEWTYSPKAGAWYFMPMNRKAPPYRRQIVAEAVIDLDDDGKLAGVDVFTNAPEPAKLRGIPQCPKRGEP